MEILFFCFVFVCLFLYEQTRETHPAQWIEVLPEIHSNWEQYEIPSYQRRGISIVCPETALIEKKQKIAANGRSGTRSRKTASAA